MKNLGDAQLAMFKVFMDEVISEDLKSSPKKLFKDYKKGGFERISRKVKKVIPENEDDYSTIGWTTLRNYRESYVGSAPLTYAKKKMNGLAFFIGFESYEAFVDKVKNAVVGNKYKTADLIIYRTGNKGGKREEKFSYEIISKLSKNEVFQHIDALTRKKVVKRKDPIFIFWLGVLYLKWGSYDKAVENLLQCIELNPINEEYYYNLALAKFNGKCPFRLSIDEIQEIRSHLGTALDLNPHKRKFYLLQCIIKEDFYKRQGLMAPIGYKPNELKNLAEDEIEEKRIYQLLDISPHDFECP
ncbi:tetratricopeptide repeat protein [Aureisphaera galaxeae]|uniref:tetratricopeptide repeat protein n=1 Tax=Aureisphaera galaxeae TaxID=1538023 RepID=UPI002350A057|nr:tetratricopeptide repeat protein [Aureisphaera galaxeae]MDC8003103.1 tetratricopeptide repeat protein [Aureisphaera galaxeae]